MKRYEMWGTPDGVKMRESGDLNKLLKLGEELDEDGQRWIIIDTKTDLTVKYSKYHTERVEELEAV